MVLQMEVARPNVVSPADIFKVLPRTHTIRVCVDGQVQEAAILTYAYTQKLQDDEECVRPQKARKYKPNSPRETYHLSERISFKAWNYWNLFGVRASQRGWLGMSLPQYVVIAPSQNLEGAVVVEWADASFVTTKTMVQGIAPFGKKVVGTLSACTNGIYSLFIAQPETVVATSLPVVAPAAAPASPELQTAFNVIDVTADALHSLEQAKLKALFTQVLSEHSPSVAVEAFRDALKEKLTPATETQPEVQSEESEPAVEETTPVATPETEEAPTTEGGYKGDPFTTTEDGHFVGDDGFVVPGSFEEFYTWSPEFISKWVAKRLGYTAPEQDVEDWTQDLLIHMKFLPEGSKHRLAGANGREHGCEDVIQTFNPHAQYGASERRFRNYINNILANKFNTMNRKRKNNPVCRDGVLSFNQNIMEDGDARCSGEITDEYLYSHSDFVIRSADRQQKQAEDRMFTVEFIEFVKQADPSVLPAIEAIVTTSTQSQAAEYLSEVTGMVVSDSDFVRLKNRLKLLADCFINGAPVPQARKPYKKRVKAEEISIA